MRQGFPSASIPAAGPLRQAGPMAWRVADAADAFDSLSMPVPSRVYGPAEPSEAAVPRGASALLGASPSEPLAVAVARMVFRRWAAARDSTSPGSSCSLCVLPCEWRTDAGPSSPGQLRGIAHGGGWERP